MNKNKLEPFIFLIRTIGIPLGILFILFIVGESFARLVIRPNSVSVVDQNVYRKSSAEFSKIFTYNDDGNRDTRNYQPFAEGDTTRILIVGDSYVMGTGLGDNETWPRLLESNLRNQDIPIEIIPYTKGYETSDQTLCLPSLIERYHPDQIIFNVVAHDIFRNEAYKEAVKKFEPPKGGARMQKVSATNLRSATAVRLLLLKSDWMYSYVYANSFRGSWFKKPESDFMNNQMAISIDWLTRAKTICDSSDVKFGLFSTPQLFQIIEYGKEKNDYSINWIDKSLAEFGKDFSVPVVSLLPVLSKASSDIKGPVYYTINGHPTPIGAKVIADYLAEKYDDWVTVNQ